MIDVGLALAFRQEVSCRDLTYWDEALAFLLICMTLSVFL